MLWLLLSAWGLKLVMASTVLEFGACPNATTMEDFQFQNLSGKWYHILSFPTDSEFIACTNSIYTIKENVLEVETKGKVAGGNEKMRQGVMAMLPDSDSGELQLDSDDMPPMNIWVVYTDYTNVACLYSCTSFPGLRVDAAWALSRSPRPLVKLIKQCRSYLNELGINTTKFKRVPQSPRCFKRN
ncbi:apolipoprotein D-like [Oratosquilla oratoria]|uniref:apolipoprotein D-like n=1 Tax=Oratosquilla oratoria TaxID=337810 RepID=UPI003F768C26